MCFIKKISQLKSDIQPCWCKSFSLKQESGLIGEGFQTPRPSPWIGYRLTMSGECTLSNGFQKFFSVGKSSVECVLRPRNRYEMGRVQNAFCLQTNGYRMGGDGYGIWVWDRHTTDNTEWMREWKLNRSETFHLLPEPTVNFGNNHSLQIS